MHPQPFLWTRSALASAALAALAACGGGGDGSSASSPPTTPPAAVTATYVEGVAATGKALAGATVNLVDASGTQRSSTASSAGAYQIAVNDLTAPFVISTTDSAGATLYSYADAAGTANINPLSDLIVRSAARGAAVESGHSTIQSNIESSRVQFQTLFQPVLESYGVSTRFTPVDSRYDPISSTFAMGDALDKLLDDIKVSVAPTGDRVTVTSLANSKTVYSSTIGATGAFTSAVASSNLAKGSGGNGATTAPGGANSTTPGSGTGGTGSGLPGTGTGTGGTSGTGLPGTGTGTGTSGGSLPTPPGAGTGTETGSGTGTTNISPPGCSGPFGQVQAEVKDAINANLAASGLKPGYIAYREKIGEVKVFDGGTVPNYRFTYVVDATYNLDLTLKASNKPQNGLVKCTINSSGGVTSTNYSNMEAADAKEFCNAIAESASALKPQHAAMSLRGMNAKTIQFTPNDTSATTSGKVDLRANVFVDTDNKFDLPPGSSTDAFKSNLDACKSWYTSSDTAAANPYPKYYSSFASAYSSSTVTEFGVCIDPESNIGKVPGFFAVNITGSLDADGDNTKTSTGEVFIAHTTQVDLDTLGFYQFKSTDPETGKTSYMQANVPMHLVKPVTSVDQALPPGNQKADCAYDIEAEKWFGYGSGASTVEPHLEACSSFKSMFLEQVRTQAYNGFYVNKQTVTFPNGDVQQLPAADALSVGMAMMAGAGLGALGIGNFEPNAQWSNGALQGAEAKSTAKFISVTPMFGTGTIPGYTDPETGEVFPATTVKQPSKQVGYTIEAPSCD